MSHASLNPIRAPQAISSNKPASETSPAKQPPAIGTDKPLTALHRDFTMLNAAVGGAAAAGTALATAPLVNRAIQSVAKNAGNVPSLWIAELGLLGGLSGAIGSRSATTAGSATLQGAAVGSFALGALGAFASLTGRRLPIAQAVSFTLGAAAFGAATGAIGGAVGYATSPTKIKK